MEKKSIDEIAQNIYNIYHDIESTPFYNVIINKDKIIERIFHGPMICIENIIFDSTKDLFTVQTQGIPYYGVYQSEVNVYSSIERDEIYKLFRRKIKNTK